jgi:hypothetical protein
MRKHYSTCRRKSDGVAEHRNKQDQAAIATIIFGQLMSDRGGDVGRWKGCRISE